MVVRSVAPPYGRARPGLLLGRRHAPQGEAGAVFRVQNGGMNDSGDFETLGAIQLMPLSRAYEVGQKVNPPYFAEAVLEVVAGEQDTFGQPQKKQCQDKAAAVAFSLRWRNQCGPV